MSEESSIAKDVYDIEIDYTPIIISIVVIAVILFLMWFFSGTDVAIHQLALQVFQLLMIYPLHLI